MSKIKVKGVSNIYAMGRGAVAIPKGEKAKGEFNDTPESSLGESQEVYRDDEDADYFLYRNISKAIVGGGTWKATDFSVGTVLFDSVSLLDDIPAFTNHMHAVGYGIGRVIDPVWQTGYTNDKGVPVPEGINAWFAIPKGVEKHEDLVAELKSKYNPNDSCSVGVSFEWEASHEFESEWDFWYHLGEMITNEDGSESMVRRIVTKVNYYYESSLVAFGADPYAKKMKGDDKEGYSAVNSDEKAPKRVINGEMGLCLDAFSDKKQFLDYIVNSGICKKEKEKVNLQKEKPQQSQKMDEQSQKRLSTLLSLVGVKSLDELDEATFNSLKGKMEGEKSDGAEILQLQTDASNAKEALTTKTSEYDAVKAELDLMKEKYKDADSFIEFGKARMKDARAMAEKLYLAQCQKNASTPSDNVLNKFKSDNPEQLEASISLMGGNLAFSGVCGDCKSSNIVMRSTEAKEDILASNPKKDTKGAEYEDNTEKYLIQKAKNDSGK